MSDDTMRFIDPTRGSDGFSQQEQNILETVNQKVAAGQGVQQIIDYLFDATLGIFPCDRISITFLEDENRSVVSYYTRAIYEDIQLKKGYSEALRGKSLEQVLQRGVPRVIGDLSRYLETHPHSNSTRLLVREGVASSMTCPLIIEGRPVGFLFRSSRQPNAYDEHQVRLHLAMAERLTQAVDKAYRIEQLIATNHAYTEMLGFVSHELKNPVAAIIMQARLILDGYVGEVPEQQRQYLQQMVAKGEYLLDLVRDYLDLARMEGRDIQFSPRTVDFAADVLGVTISIVQTQAQAKQMRISVQCEPTPIEVDPELMRIAMVNLIGNAVKYGKPGSEIKVTCGQVGERFSVSVWNAGPGFPHEQRDQLFRKFSRLQSPALLKEKGTGVGLYTVWRIVQLHGGRIYADSAEGQWAEFRFEIPQKENVETSKRRNVETAE